jgi:hypothetical protein
MSVISAPRAKLVELLWQLKQRYDSKDDGRSIHFNTLLRDSDYRRAIIEEASQSSDRDIRNLGRSLRVLNADGELSQPRRSVDTASVNPDIAEMLGVKAGSERPQKRQPVALLAVGLVVIIGIALATVFLHADNEIVLSGSLRGEQLWTAEKTWVIDDIVYLEAGARLTIEPGTKVLGRAGAALVVTRDATIMARGSVAQPIVFSSAKPAGQRAAGDWGGVILLGNAPVNLSGAQIEGIPKSDSRGSFGGADGSSNCGVLEYARIEFAGYEVYANNELNGLTLGGCGRDTIVRNVQVHRALDDGIEVFGGNVDMKHILITGAGDDSLDWDMGWTGRVQFLQVLQYAGAGDNAIEADNREGRADAEPISEPQIYNVTLLSEQSQEKYQRAMNLRRGTGGHFYNMVISGFSGEAIDIRDPETVARIDEGRLSFGSVLISNIGVSGRNYFADESGDKDDDGGFGETAYFKQHAELGSEPKLLTEHLDEGPTDFAVSADSPARVQYVSLPQGEFWDEAANYSGAVRPGATANWMDGWTTFPLN